MSLAVPRGGDVIIHRQVHSPAVYVLSRHDGPLQYFDESYDTALAQAKQFARQAKLDVWYTLDELTFERVATHRRNV